MTRSEQLARKEIRAIVTRAVSMEAGVSQAATRRIINRILRESERLADIGKRLDASVQTSPAQTLTPQELAAMQAPVVVLEGEHDDFDPYAIGAVVTLHKLGAGGLMERLVTVASTKNLERLARAQNLAINGSWSNADELRAAIVQCAEQKLAERRAAAS